MSVRDSDEQYLPTEPAPAEPTDDGGLGETLAGARPADSPALVLARARVGGALFGNAIGLGRFRVLERLGGGGMGVVYAAYDPELDRGVALKTLHVPRTGRELALAEAKTLARLAHPNIVPVFDVGIEGEQIYIVMELIRGDTLREWVKGRSQREILEVYRQAGQALAAAHSAGLVHRDFKPDNAIAGNDDRVRVVDFGLACEAAIDTTAAATGRAAGTPRYMAPEQAAGAPVTPAADQYSFGVSLDEALRSEPGRSVPRWLELVIERATAADPTARFASMHALLRALGRDPARRWRWRVAVGAVAAVVAAAFAIGRASLVGADEPCSGGGQAIASAWAPAGRQREVARIALLSSYGREVATQLAHRLGDYTVRWADNHRSACLASRRGEQSAALLDRRMGCLDRGRAALAALAEIAGGADAQALPGVARAARGLPEPDACDARSLATTVEPPAPALAGAVAGIRARLEHARVQLAAGQADEARTTGAGAVAAARALGYRPVLAEALLIHGRALVDLDDRLAAIAGLTEATQLGFASGSQPTAVEAWARRAWVEGTGDRPEAALDGFAVVDALATQSSPGLAFARALLHNNVASVELGRGHRAAAVALLERALDEARLASEGAVELVSIRSNLAIATDDPVRRDQLLGEAHAELARLLGDSHPDTLGRQFIHATTVVSLRRAAALLAPVCEQQERHAWLAPATALCWTDLADLRAELGDRTAALAALARAIALGAAQHPNTPEAAGYRLLWTGDPAAASRAFAGALERFPPTPGEVWYWAYTRARLSLGLGRALAAQQRTAAAITALEGSIAVLEPLARDHAAVSIDRRLGRARAELARLRAASGPPSDAIRSMAAAAARWLRSADAPPTEIVELERIAEQR